MKRAIVVVLCVLLLFAGCSTSSQAAVPNANTAKAVAQVVFDGMEKDELFDAVIQDGSLPRKTFSMGHADDKRFYLEGRKIK